MIMHTELLELQLNITQNYDLTEQSTWRRIRLSWNVEATSCVTPYVRRCCWFKAQLHRNIIHYFETQRWQNDGSKNFI